MRPISCGRTTACVLVPAVSCVTPRPGSTCRCSPPSSPPISAACSSVSGRACASKIPRGGDTQRIAALPSIFVAPSAFRRRVIVPTISMSDPTSSGQSSGSSLVNRLLAERREAHRRYNEALTLLDRAIQSSPDLPDAPPAYDETLLPRINDTWMLLPKEGHPEAGFVSRLGPSWPAIETPF